MLTARRSRLALLPPPFASALLLLMVLANPTGAHIGGKVYPIYELTGGDLSQLDLHDASVAGGEQLLPEPSLVARQFYADPTVGDGAQYDPADPGQRTCLAWHGATGRIYLAHERTDDVYIDTYAGGDVWRIWRNDSIEFMIDGDHSGGDYTGSADPGWTAAEQQLHNNRTARMYFAIAGAPDGPMLAYAGLRTWANRPPYADGGGGHAAGIADTSTIEFCITPFDDLRWDSAEASMPSRLSAGSIVGFMINVPDWDAPGTYHAFYSLQGEPAGRRRSTALCRPIRRWPPAPGRTHGYTEHHLGTDQGRFEVGR